MKRYLQIDGGGIRGILPAVVLTEMELRTNQKIHEMFDFVSGSSTGAIIGGCAAAGVPMRTVMDLYINDGKSLFTPRSVINPANWFRGKYDRSPFVEYLERYIGQRKMAEAKTRYMATAFNLVNGTTEFIKSWKTEHGFYKITDVISWSALSAAYYFGKICVPGFSSEYRMPDGKVKVVDGAVFQDGGQGLNNCTLGYILTDLMASDEEQAVILSIGCGTSEVPSTYEQAAKTEFFGQIVRYPFQARGEATESQISAAAYVASKRPGIKFFRLDCEIPKDADKLDAVSHIGYFVKQATELAKKIPMIG